MALREHVKENFQTLLRAAEHGDLALLECTREGKPVSVIVAMNKEEDGGVTFVPFAVMYEGSPYRLRPRRSSRGTQDVLLMGREESASF